MVDLDKFEKLVGDNKSNFHAKWAEIKKQNPDIFGKKDASTKRK